MAEEMRKLQEQLTPEYMKEQIQLALFQMKQDEQRKRDEAFRNLLGDDLDGLTYGIGEQSKIGEQPYNYPLGGDSYGDSDSDEEPTDELV